MDLLVSPDQLRDALALRYGHALRNLPYYYVTVATRR